MQQNNVPKIAQEETDEEIPAVANNRPTTQSIPHSLLPNHRTATVTVLYSVLCCAAAALLY